MPDLNVREWLALAPIALATIWMGVYPESFMAPMRKDVGVLLARIEKAAPAGDAHLTAGKPHMKKDAHGGHAAEAAKGAHH
jgi:NADH-quinone oxidoreductase subunit M